MKLLLLVVAVIALSAVDAAKEKAIKVKDKDMMRKMIIYDKVKTLLETLRWIWSQAFWILLEKSEHVLLPRAE